jgi:Flp pilus assembly protein TadG
MKRQAGSTIVEFSMVLVLFLTFTLGLMDFSRLLFTWNAATEATRHGARYAAACVDPGGSYGALLDKMREMLPAITAYDVTWDPKDCSATTCKGVTVTITNFNFEWLAPIPNAVRPTLLIPATSFSTYLPRESLRQDPYSATFCQ